MKMTLKELRAALSREASGKVIESLKWDDVEEYWVMTFTDGSEICWLRTMAEEVNIHGSTPRRRRGVGLL